MIELENHYLAYFNVIMHLNYDDQDMIKLFGERLLGNFG